MKKIIITAIIYILLSPIAHAQAITKKDARHLLEQALTYLKTSDTTSFINLWRLDDAPYPYHQRPYTRADVIGDFNQLKVFLDTALKQNLTIDNIEIEQAMQKDTAKNFGEYKIKAWFRYDEHYYKGFGFYVEYKNNKWVIRFSPDTSVMRKN
ncbi:MAG: hypothetical protein JJE25_07520 [Bacteroidia bacterium]|nr:hypothetical protein [Bacteroidia bacterium]